MKPLHSKHFGFILLLALAMAVHYLHVQAARPEATDRNAPLILPKGSFLRTVSMGQQTTLADAYWLRLVQYIGTQEVAVAAYPQLQELVDLVTDLDPEYGYAYMVGGLLLGARGRIDESCAILEKGIRQSPPRWELPFYLAFNHWFQLGNTAEGARWLRLAADDPNAPAFVHDLLARLYSSSGQIETAIEFASRMRDQATTQRERQILTTRIEGLLVERELQLLERAIARYHSTYGHPPTRLRALVPEFLSALPNDQFGIEYNPLTATVTSPLLPKRLLPARPEGL
jgi:tetratricopeptide (TPR) repeat protein